MDEIILFNMQIIRRVAVLHSRECLDNVSSFSADIQVIDSSRGAHVEPSWNDPEHVTPILEHSSRLCGVDCQP